MRRPILFVLLSFISGIVFQHEYIEKQLCFVGIACFFFVFIITLLLTNFKSDKEIQLKRICYFIMAFIFFFSAGSLYLAFASKSIDPLYTKSNEDLVIKGTVITMQIKSESYYNILLKSDGGFKRLVQITGKNPKPQEVIGTKAVINGIVVLPETSRNPCLFDYKLYLRTKGIDVIIKTDSSKIKYLKEDKNILYNSLAELKYDFLDKIRADMDERNFGIFNGMLFGDRSFMSDEIYESFQKNGTAHILSVSGIHVGILYIYINKLFRNKKRSSTQIIIMIMLIFYAALSEFSPSVVRAVMMIMVHIISQMLFKRYDFLCCGSFCALIMILFNPYYIFNVGFQLSYLAIFCLAVVLPWLNRRIKILEEEGKNDLIIGLAKAAAPLIVIQLSMAPLSAYLFNYFSFASFFANIPVIAISGLIIPIGILMIIISMISDLILAICISFCEILISIMVYINDIFYIPRIGYFNVKSPDLLSVLIFYFVIFFITSECFRILFQRRKRINLICIILALTVFASVSSAVLDDSQKKANLVFVDVGQGDCIHIRTESGKNVLIDGGGKVDYNVGEKILLPYLLKNNVKYIDLAIVTHLHTDHFQGIKELSNEMIIKKLGTFETNRLNEKEILKDTSFAPNQLLYLSAGNRIYLEKDVYIDVLYPNKPIKNDRNSEVENPSISGNDLINEDENLNSLLIKIYYKGKKILITGDMGFSAEEKIMELYKSNLFALNADVLKIGHHGSNSSTSDKFLEVVDPDIAIFQVGKNNYGHPSPSVIEKCRKKDIIIYRNDFDGAIIFKEKEQKWLIRTML